jgi:transposase-like protein
VARRRKRKSYTEQQRKLILAAAAKQGLTAAQVKTRFGVTPVTYYSWRKKTGVARRRGTALGSIAGPGLEGQVRSEVRARVRKLLPGIVRAEVNTFLDSLLGSGRGRRRV